MEIIFSITMLVLVFIIIFLILWLSEDKPSLAYLFMLFEIYIVLMSMNIAFHLNSRQIIKILIKDGAVEYVVNSSTGKTSLRLIDTTIQKTFNYIKP